ncbi:MAG: hypothetical protein QG591_94 [Planctomycetota bacterium]|nr:hypothetical protein [Planctomycetota bacterium]
MTNVTLYKREGFARKAGIDVNGNYWMGYYIEPSEYDGMNECNGEYNEEEFGEPSDLCDCCGNPFTDRGMVCMDGGEVVCLDCVNWAEDELEPDELARVERLIDNCSFTDNGALNDFWLRMHGRSERIGGSDLAYYGQYQDIQNYTRDVRASIK